MVADKTAEQPVIDALQQALGQETIPLMVVVPPDGPMIQLPEYPILQDDLHQALAKAR